VTTQITSTPAINMLMVRMGASSELLHYARSSRQGEERGRASRIVRVNDRFWPIATLPQEFMSAMPPKADKPELMRMTQLD